MADCPKCGRQLSIAGSCIKCGNLNDRSKWYAIAEEEEKKQQAAPKQPAKAGANRPRRPPSSAARKDWYQAAGMDVPADHPVEQAQERVPGEVPIDPDDHHAWAEVSRGRKDPPFAKIGAGLGLAVCVAGLVAYARCGAAPETQAVVNLPAKFVNWDHSYGFKIEPPEGFKRQQVEMPDFARGVHRELTQLSAYVEAKSGVEAYYFAEVREHTNLAEYAKLSVSDLGNLTTLTAFPDGVKAHPTQGYLIDMGARKALVYVSSAEPNRYFTIWVLSPSTTFAKNQSEIEAAARAFTIVTPDGPPPGSHFAPAP